MLIIIVVVVFNIIIIVIIIFTLPDYLNLLTLIDRNALCSHDLKYWYWQHRRFSVEHAHITNLYLSHVKVRVELKLKQAALNLLN